ncbi:MAG: glycoside hydrolase family 36 protein, partial [Candidatus Scatosoma sp.]
MTALLFENEKASLEFAVGKGQITIRKVCFFGEEYVNFPAGMQHSYVFIVGQAYRRKIINRYGVGGEILRYKAHRFLQGENKKQLIVEEENERVVVVTTYTLYDGNATLECKKEVRNVSRQPFTLECVSPLTLKGIFLQGEVIRAEESETVEDPTTRFDTVHAEGENDDLPYLWRMNSSWCSEGNFERLDLAKEGLRTKSWRNRYNKILVHNNGTMTTNRFFPFGMLEKEKFGYFAFELLPTGSWSYEIETGIYDWDSQALMVCLTGKTLGDNGWSKILPCGEIYETETVRVVGASEVETVAENLLGARRIAHRKHMLTPYADVVYNGFMFNNWDCPTEAKDEKNIPVVAERGADYYVIDAGWHDRGEGISPTIEAGEWRENGLRYPGGLQKTIERVRAKGMKFGFWVELQSIGIHCPNKNILPEHCFFHVDGVRTVCNNRWQLDYSQYETRDWATATISRLIARYSPDYIKIDYNQIQTATECKTGSPTEGVCAHSRAYLKWFKEIQDAYPQVLFETCSSGGMLMDANHASLATVFSVSDSNDCYAYPTMLGNLFTLLM